MDRAESFLCFQIICLFTLDLATESHYVTWSPGVKRFVSFSDAPLPLEENVVRFLKENADSEGVITAHSQLQRGQAVEISGGPFNGLAAIIQDPPDAKGRVKVLLKLMSRHISVKLGVEVLKSEGGACGLAASCNIRAEFVFGAPLKTTLAAVKFLKSVDQQWAELCPPLYP